MSCSTGSISCRPSQQACQQHSPGQTWQRWQAAANHQHQQEKQEQVSVQGLL